MLNAKLLTKISTLVFPDNTWFVGRAIFCISPLSRRVFPPYIEYKSHKLVAPLAGFLSSSSSFPIVTLPSLWVTHLAAEIPQSKYWGLVVSGSTPCQKAKLFHIACEECTSAPLPSASWLHFIKGKNKDGAPLASITQAHIFSPFAFYFQGLHSAQHVCLMVQAKPLVSALCLGSQM